MSDKEKLATALAKAEKVLSGFDFEFFKRIWTTDLQKFEERLKQIGFCNFDNVLDAGFGNAQWTICLARSNKFAHGIEYSAARTEAGKIIVNELGIPNVDLKHGSIEEMPYSDNFFDAIFSYSVIYLTDYKRSLREFYRVLKPGGKLYLNTNGLGWYLHNLLEGHNDSANFSTRQMAINTLKATVKYYTTGETTPGSCIVTPKDTIRREMEEIGFKNMIFAAEGTINVDPVVKANPFFKGEYHNEEGVFEVLAQK